MKRDINRCDTNNYAVDNAYGIQLANKKVSDLKQRCTPCAVTRKKVTKKIKGIKNNIVAKLTMFDDYMRCLRDEIETMRQ